MTQLHMKMSDKLSDYYIDSADGICVHKTTEKIITLDKWKKLAIMNWMEIL